MLFIHHFIQNFTRLSDEKKCYMSCDSDDEILLNALNKRILLGGV